MQKPIILLDFDRFPVASNFRRPLFYGARRAKFKPIAGAEANAGETESHSEAKPVTVSSAEPAPISPSTQNTTSKLFKKFLSSYIENINI